MCSGVVVLLQVTLYFSLRSFIYFSVECVCKNLAKYNKFYISFYFAPSYIK